MGRDGMPLGVVRRTSAVEIAMAMSVRYVFGGQPIAWHLTITRTMHR